MNYEPWFSKYFDSSQLYKGNTKFYYIYFITLVVPEETYKIYLVKYN